MKLSEFIKERRIELELTQAEIGLKLGYRTSQYISNVERKYCMFSRKKLAKLSKILQCDINQLKAMWLEEYVQKLN